MKWQICSSTNRDVIVAQAIKLGWADNKVQVRKERGLKVMWYIIEPYEEGCACRNLLKYKDFAPIEAVNEG